MASSERGSSLNYLLNLQWDGHVPTVPGSLVLHLLRLRSQLPPEAVTRGLG